MTWRQINSDEQLRAELAACSTPTAVAVDTEFMRQDTFYPKPALVQLCFTDIALLIDPLAIDDCSPLNALFSDPSVIKIIHSASEDLEVFKLWPGVMPQPLFDTQRAAALLNRGFGLGYRALVQQLLAIDLPKGETRSNWLARPLSQSQCDYAAQDVIYLRQAYDVLMTELADSPKNQWVLAEGQEAIQNADRPTDYSLRIKSAWKLSQRQLMALKMLINWREDTAIARNKPRSWIVDDRACYSLAEAMPESVRQLSALNVLRDSTIRRRGQELIAVLDEARAYPEQGLPPRAAAPLKPAQRAALKKLRVAADRIATQLQIASEILVQNRDLDMLVREAVGELIEPPLAWSGWREEAVINPLRSQLVGLL